MAKPPRAPLAGRGGVLVHLHPLHVEVGVRTEVVLGPVVAALVDDELRAAVPGPRGLLPLRVVRVDRHARALAGARLVHGGDRDLRRVAGPLRAGGGVAPLLGRPIPTKAQVQHELLRRHHVGRVRAAAWNVPLRRGEGIVGDDVAVPRVGLRGVAGQVGGLHGRWHLEDLEVVLRPLRADDDGLARQLLSGLQRERVGRTADLSRVVGHAVVVPGEIELSVRELRTPGLVEQAWVELAVIVETGVE
mmetsp:Transcript_47470/g.123169  ORF Transcript_47470/g.123169 Transcript_47470/m.123169 type:complete len:247 (-) Transcript_47470:680-1420(-)